MSFDNKEYHLNQLATILIHDNTKNKNPGIPDIFSIIVTSDTNPDGFEILVVETAKDNGFFTGAVEFSKDDNRRKLQVSLGDNVYVDFKGSKESARIIGDPILCGPDKVTLDDLNCLSKASMGYDPASQLSVTTGKQIFYIGEPIVISGFAIHHPSHVNSTGPVLLKIIDPESNTVFEKTITADTSNTFSFDIDNRDETFDIEGDYTVKVQRGKSNGLQKDTSTFELKRLILLDAVNKNTVFILPGTDKPGCHSLGECFRPTELEVGVGSKVTWINADPLFKHLIVSGANDDKGDGLYRSHPLAAAGKFSYQFNQTGIYHYHDAYFPWMTGIINVKQTHLLADITPPLILLPDDILVDAESSSGAAVNFSAKAIDDLSGVLEPECTHKSGSVFKIGSTTVTCTVTDNEGNQAVREFKIDVKRPDAIIPKWVKEVTDLWCQDEINDDSFIEAVQYLIKNHVIIVQATQDTDGQPQNMPDWIKDNACWWSEGKTSDEEFAESLKFLISKGIVKV